jgi:hypothetical protein
MRKAYEQPPLNDGNPPTVTAVSGLDIAYNGGAGVLKHIGSGWGIIQIRTGKAPSVNWSITLGFATAPPLLFVSLSTGDPVTITNNGTTAITISGAVKLVAYKSHELYYEWSAV